MQIGDHRNDEIEALRAIAILLTVVQHFQALVPDPEPLRMLVGGRFGFWTGVDLFFVVSGFVITGSLRRLREARERGQSVRPELFSFWIKRAFRLLPTAWLWLLIVLVVGRMASTGPPAGGTGADLGVLAAMLNVLNFVGAWCTHGHAEAPVCQSLLYIGHYWSLALEEQFYLLLPLLLIVVPRRAQAPLAAAAIAACVLFPRPMFSLAWYTRADGLLWGVLIALVAGSPLHARVEPRVLARSLWSPVVVLVLVYALIRIPAAWAGIGMVFTGPPRGYSMSAIAFAGAMLVWLASYEKGYIVPANRLRRGLSHLAARSYSIYVIHLPVFTALHVIATRAGAPRGHAAFDVVLIVAGCALVLLLADANYRYVERPLRDYGRRLAARAREHSKRGSHATVD